MSNAVESQKIADEKKGWKGLFVAFILSILFLGIFYLAMENEPDYMPSKQQAVSNQTAFKNAPVMSQEALAEAEKQRNAASGEISHMQHGNAEAHSEHNSH